MENLYEKYCFINLEKKYNLFFDDKDLLVKAFTHSSFKSENNENYERLEFLGDAILEMMVSDFFYREFSNKPEGIMSKERSRLVNENSLFKVMELEELEQYIITGLSIIKDDSFLKKKPAYVADIYEAFIAAIYLDQGIEKTQEFIKKTLLNRYELLINIEESQDYKTKLQEILQKEKIVEIKYETKTIDKNDFFSEVYVDNIKIGSGRGYTKKNAEQNAAKEALNIYG